MSELPGLKLQRKNIKASFTRIFNFCSQNAHDLDHVNIRNERIDELYKEYLETQHAIDNLIQDEDAQLVEETYREEMENYYFDIKALCRRLLATTNQQQQPILMSPPQNNADLTAAVQSMIEHQATMSQLMERFMRIENTSTPNERAQQSSEISLPRIQLPDFDGNLLNWLRFRDLFTTMIHNRSSLANIEKLEYLQSKVKGEAAAVIKHISPTDTNYQVAWDLLKKKYNNMEKVKAAYMELLFEQPPMKVASLSEIKRIYNSANEGYNAIDENVSHWNTVLLFSLEKKLDGSTAALWYRGRKHEQAATFDEFLEFCEKRVYELESLQNTHHTNRDQLRRPPARVNVVTSRTCPICTGSHIIYQCDDFKKANVEQRRLLAQERKLCFNCLQEGHQAVECQASSCKKCSKRHNTMLHILYQRGAMQPPKINTIRSNNVQNDSSMIINESLNNETTTTLVSSKVTQSSNMCVILPTAIIKIIDSSNSIQCCRALLDSGSQGTLITEACVQRMSLKKQHDQTIVYGLGSSNGKMTKGSVNLCIAMNDKSTITAKALVLNSLTQILPPKATAASDLQWFQQFQMADPHWNQPNSIDIILGADIVMECLLGQKRMHPNGSLSAVNTIFGWVIMGKAHFEYQYHIMTNSVCLNSNLEQCLTRFWETEEIAVKSKSLSPEEEQVENFYKETTERDVSGRYKVRLPLKNRVVDLGESKRCALKRLASLEKKFRIYTELENEYKKFLREYIELKHMQTIDESKYEQICYLPHHAVFKPTSTTTKIRVVFDASCKTSNGKSLNDNLMVGQKVQRDLFDIMISFRLHEIAFIGDIEKMYRQVMIHENDLPLQCILWRDAENQDVKTYSLNTVTYGTASAAYLATRTLNQIAYDNETLYPVAARSIIENFYVDDYMCSVEHPAEAVQLKNEICKILDSAGFKIRKWASNSVDFMNSVDNAEKAITYTEMPHDSIVSTLGLLWDTERDVIKYAITQQPEQQAVTKRMVLSNIAKIYDPMGWIAPVVVRFKVIMQRLWLIGLGWDDPLPINMTAEWAEMQNSLEMISDIQIPRWVHLSMVLKAELHGLSDASEIAYAATVYIKIYISQNVTVSYLLAAKTRVAPVKQISMPRMELCAAHLLVKLMTKISEILNRPDIELHGWSDSTIVLAWLSDHPRRWPTFVANRTSQIISVMPASQWHHIKSGNNPADLATRGIHPSQLKQNMLWWLGPNELHKEYPAFNIDHAHLSDLHLEQRRNWVVNTNQSINCKIIDRYSSMTKLLRVTALLLRFTHNCINKQDKRLGFISLAELRLAHKVLVKISQIESFKEEIKVLKSGRQLPEKHHLSSLAPFIDDVGILRVGGRLVNACIPYDQKHPVIHCHAQKRLLYYLIYTKYFITSVTKIIKEVIYKCISCQRQRTKLKHQQICEVPAHRIVPTPVFANIGIDYAGAVQVLAGQ